MSDIYFPDFDEYDDEDLDWLREFRDPGGSSALRAGIPEYPCPICGRPDQLTLQDVELGYQCDYCADALEGHFGGPMEDY